MHGHPVHFSVEREDNPRRIHVAVRAVLLIALGTVGLGAVSWVAYLAAPAIVALAVLQRGASRYLTEDAPRLARALRWIAAASAYLALLTDAPPTSGPGPVGLRVEATGAPTPGSALLRLVTSLPALLLVVLLSVVAGACWLVGAIWILAVERLPAPLADFLTLTVRVELRLFAYHLSLVDVYPSLAEEPMAHAPT
jgi:hypothetical protein